jgi:hypothetical protein
MDSGLLEAAKEVASALKDHGLDGHLYEVLRAAIKREEARRATD